MPKVYDHWQTLMENNCIIVYLECYARYPQFEQKQSRLYKNVVRNHDALTAFFLEHHGITSYSIDLKKEISC